MKERMLTVLVPIKDSDAVVVNELPAINSDNINVIYKLGNTYKRIQKNDDGNYEYVDVVDREFPYLGKPLEIFDFTYDATRMGPAPTISAQGVMWFADKNSENKDVTLEDLWNQECHVQFNGENFYLKQIPTSSKSNEDERYKYDLDFVSERVVLENVYIYDVVQPFFTEKPVSENSNFSFFGDVRELLKRINVSLIRSGLSKFVLRDNQSEETHPRLLADDTTHASDDQYFSYTDWLSINMGTYSGPLSIKDPYNHRNQFGDYDHFHENIFDHYSGDYNAYLRNEVYRLDERGELIVQGYVCRIGKDKYGDDIASEEKMVSFENNKIHEALQQIKDTYGLQYYIEREKGSDGKFTGNTLIVVGDCEHDFADMNESGTDYARNIDGIPVTEHPFDYGVDDELLSKEKTNTTDEIVTRITGIGSSENIPWHYPNPTGDGWIKPVYKRNGEVLPIEIDYPQNEGDDPEGYVRYEKYLKNRLGNVFKFGFAYTMLRGFSYIEKVGNFKSFLTGDTAQIVYQLDVRNNTKIRCSAANNYDVDNTSVSYRLYRIEPNEYVDVTSAENAFLLNGGVGVLQAAKYILVYSFNFATRPPVVDNVNLYYYPSIKTSISPWRTWFLGALMSTLGSVLEMDIDMYSEIEVVWPELITTNPNLKFNYDYNLKDCGWYYNGNRINVSSYVMEEGTHYCFLGGGGTKTIGVDNVMKVTVGKGYMCTNAPDFVVDDNIHLGCFGDEDIDASYYISALGDISRLDSPDPDVESSISPATRYNLRMPKSSDVEINHEVSINDFVSKYWDFSLDIILCDGWYSGSKRKSLSDFGILGESVLTEGADINDTIEFQRVKYVTPQPNLMPEVYIKTDGERRFYNAHNYFPLIDGVPDTMIGEESLGNKVINRLYEITDGQVSSHYVFENECLQNKPHEHIESFEDIKPSIKEQTNTITINGVEKTFRIDVVEEFGFDELDNDEVWENNEDGNISGEYKHPYIFAKLRPLGFNLFDMALQEDMVLSMTTGHCGACNFRIGVDENTKKNPVQIWIYDVYGGSTYETRGEKIYSAGDLRRWVDTSSLYYDTNGTSAGYTLVDNAIDAVRSGFLVNGSDFTDSRSAIYRQNVYPSEMILRGEVGSLKQGNRSHFEGDVKYSGRFIPSQQDTSENYVWVALMKDTDTYGTVMPSAQPDYGDDNYSRYIEPKGAHYYDRKLKQWFNLTDDEADKFVLVNIRFPQIYLRRAERKLSKELIKYMYEHNYQMFNFSIGFSRIFLADNDDIEQNINENSVLYVSFNNRIYRQYVKHYTYRMAKDAVLPEITVDMNEELSVSRTAKEREYMRARDITLSNRSLVDEAIRTVSDRLSRSMIGRNENVIVGGNVVSRDGGVSMMDISSFQQRNNSHFMQNAMGLNKTNVNMQDIVTHVNTFNTDVVSKMKQVRETLEKRVIPALTQNINESCVGSSKYYFTPTIITEGNVALFWLTSEGSEQLQQTGVCPTNQGMTDLNWSNISITL